MKKLWNTFKEALHTVNFEGIYCSLKGDPSYAEIMGAVKRQKEIDVAQKKTRQKQNKL